MSTPAAAVLDGAAGGSGAGAAPVAATPPGGAPGGAAASNQPFFDSWLPATAPENKDTRDWLANKNFADPATLVKSYRGLETEASALRATANLKGYPVDKVNADGTVIKAEDNAVKAWRTTMGVPETADKYEIPIPSANPYPQFAQYMKEGMLEANVPAAMAPKLAAAYEAAVQKMETELRASENTKSQEALMELQRAWGPQYQERTALAARGKDWLSKEVGGLDEIQLRTLEATLGTAKFMTAMWKIASGNREPGFAGGNGGAFEGGASAAQARLDQLTADRTAGKINQYQFEAQSKELIPLIAGGMAPSH